MSDTAGFFDNVGGNGAPSAKMKDLNDGVKGVIVDQFMAPKYVFGTKNKEVEKDKKTGADIEQLVIVLETEQRNWQGVSKIPLVDYDDPNSGPKPASEDDGRRAIYVPPYTNIHAAIGKALRTAKAANGIEDGATLGVKVVNLRDTGKGNPLKEHEAVYEPASASASFFGADNSVGGPNDAAQSAPAQQDPWANTQQNSAPPF